MSWKGGSTRAVIQDLFGIHTHTVMLAATGMHVGKTTLSLGVFRGLEAKWGHGRVAYCKPLGQRYKDVLLPDGRTIKVDPDVETVRNFFKLDKFAWEHMSPVVFPPGYTRKVIDGRIQTADLLHKIKDSFTALATNSDFTLLEGSGHIGVGSIVNLNNAQVAGALGVDVVMIAPGGLGVSFDQLAMNKALLEKHGAQLRGVILNKVEPSKYDMVKDYYGRVLGDLWETPLLGCIPYQPAIEKPSMSGFAKLLNSHFIAGESERFRTFDSIRLVLSALDESVSSRPCVGGVARAWW
jgi:phosphate acetyltransferase